MRDDLSAVVDRARDGSVPVDVQHAAFAEIVRRFEEQALAWAMRLVGDPEEARDATQDAFVAAWLKLRTLRDAAAFAPWLKRLVATQCRRRRRKRREDQLPGAVDSAAMQPALDQRERQRVLAKAMTVLSEEEHRIVVLFYFLGRTMIEIAALLGIPRGTVGKRLHSARLAIRRTLPAEIRKDFLPRRPSSSFAERVRQGLMDECIGDYRFEERQNHVVRVRREGSLLVSYGGGQRNILASTRDDALLTTEFDGEGRFQRDRTGRIVAFVYYECGVRLGVARKLRTSAG